jgi:hypothetical protein
MDQQNIFTPKWAIDKVAEGLAPDPAPIPKNCGFDWLMENRERIRMLQFMPIKDDDVRARYNSLDKDELARPILEQFASGIRMLTQENKFPYALGADVSQWLVWLDDDWSHEQAHPQIVKTFGTDIVSFERNRQAEGKLLKGTFPRIRHIHVWIRAEHKYS